MTAVNRYEVRGDRVCEGYSSKSGRIVGGGPWSVFDLQENVERTVLFGIYSNGDAIRLCNALNQYETQKEA